MHAYTQKKMCIWREQEAERLRLLQEKQEADAQVSGLSMYACVCMYLYVCMYTTRDVIMSAVCMRATRDVIMSAAVSKPTV
jgi:hypothetical protein